MIPSSLERYIATRDKKLSEFWVSKTPLLELFKELLERGTVEVGGRSTCGTYTDPTWKLFTSWNEVIRKACKLGYEIEVEPVRHKNKSPTTCGGYWYSNIYRLGVQKNEPDVQKTTGEGD